MYARGPAMIVLSLCCIAVAAVAQQSQKRQAIALQIASAMESRDCMADGFDTPRGRVGCLVPVSFPMAKATIGVPHD